MKHQTDKKHLLNDVLADDPEFRESLFVETARLAGRRRRGRQVRRALLSCAALVGLAVAVWPKPTQSTRQAVEAPRPERGYGLVVSAPTLNLVATQPFVSAPGITFDSSVQIVHTVAGASLFREIGDDDLLALAPGPAVLVRRGPHAADLIVLGASEEDGDN